MNSSCSDAVRSETVMSSGIEFLKGCANTLIGLAKQMTGWLLGSSELVRSGRCQLDKGRAQFAWGREERVREKALRRGDEMARKLMGR